MEFMCALKTHFKVRDLCVNHRQVKALGLGGKPYFDYTITRGRPRLRGDELDYLYFGSRCSFLHNLLGHNLVLQIRTHICPIVVALIDSFSCNSCYLNLLGINAAENCPINFHSFLVVMYRRS